MRRRSQRKGIFCIEGLWDSDLRETSTVRPILELLQLHEDIPYIHREYATREELEYYLGKWVQRRYDAFPILYLTSHGRESGLAVGSDFYSLGRMSRLLAGRCAGRLLMFSSCDTLSIARHELLAFLEKTGALGVCGYRVDVGWMRSIAFELLLFAAIQDNEFSRRGIRAIEKAALDIARAFPDLEFRMETVKTSRARPAKKRAKTPTRLPSERRAG